MPGLIILVVAGKPMECGVTDYTFQLARALKLAKRKAVVETLSMWSLAALYDLRQKYASRNVIWHIQYPSLDMGCSPSFTLLPFILRGRLFITLHEFACFHIIRKFYLLPLLLRAKGVIFTNQAEKGSLSNFCAQKNKLHIIPIGSNIPLVPLSAQRSSGLVYFGQIISGKRLGCFLETVALLRRYRISMPCTIIGSALEDGFIQQLQRHANKLNIRLKFNISSKQVSQELQRHTIALLPFPDGVSDKRGSALACLNHGLNVITQHGPQTPLWLRQSTYGFKSTADAAREIIQLAKSPAKLPISRAAKKNLTTRQWPMIAKLHRRLYG